MEQTQIGRPYWQWTVVATEHSFAGRPRTWVCQCTCGTLRYICPHALKKGQTKSCGAKGCRVMPQSQQLSKTLTYKNWRAMRTRCQNTTASNYARYGGRGIKVCPQWQSFLTFLRDMGPRPSEQHTLDRIDNTGNYEPGNVRWSTPAEQQANIRSNVNVTHDGVTMHAHAWARKLGLNPATICQRAQKGWSVKEILGFKKRAWGKRFKLNECNFTIREWAEYLHVDHDWLRRQDVPNVDFLTILEKVMSQKERPDARRK